MSAETTAIPLNAAGVRAVAAKGFLTPAASLLLPSWPLTAVAVPVPVAEVVAVAVAGPYRFAAGSKLMHAVGRAYDVSSRLYVASFRKERSPMSTAAAAVSPSPTSTLASTWVRVSKTSSRMPVALLTVSHPESTWRTVERVLVRSGESRDMPAPAVPLPLKKLMPRRRAGWKPPMAVRARVGRAAWKGRAVTLVLELGGRVRCLCGRGWWGRGYAYKPDWVELVVFLRSSRTLESFGIYSYGQFVVYRCEGGLAYLYFEAVGEVDGSCEFEPHEYPRHELRAYRCNTRYLWVLSGTSVNDCKDRSYSLGRVSGGWLAKALCSYTVFRKRRLCSRALYAR